MSKIAIANVCLKDIWIIIIFNKFIAFKREVMIIILKQYNHVVYTTQFCTLGIVVNVDSVCYMRTLPVSHVPIPT